MGGFYTPIYLFFHPRNYLNGVSPRILTFDVCMSLMVSVRNWFSVSRFIPAWFRPARQAQTMNQMSLIASSGLAALHGLVVNQESFSGRTGSRMLRRLAHQRHCCPAHQATQLDARAARQLLRRCLCSPRVTRFPHFLCNRPAIHLQAPRSPAQLSPQIRHFSKVSV